MPIRFQSLRPEKFAPTANQEEGTGGLGRGLWDRAQAFGTILAAVVALIGLLQRDLSVWATVILVVLAALVGVSIAPKGLRVLISSRRSFHRRKKLARFNLELNRLVSSFPQWLELGHSSNFVAHISSAIHQASRSRPTILPTSPVIFLLHFQRLRQLWPEDFESIDRFRAKVDSFDAFLRVFHEAWVLNPLRWLQVHSDCLEPDAFTKIRHYKLAYDTFLINYTELCRQISAENPGEPLASWTYDRGPEL